MNDAGHYCPIALGSDVIADRWTPLILREMVLGNTRFNEIVRGLPGISRSLLVRRLKHLQRMHVIERHSGRGGSGGEYILTPAGRDLEQVLMALGRWTLTWMYDDLRPTNIDPVNLMWHMHRLVDRAQLPARRVVVQFDHTAPVRMSLWLVFERREVSVCIQHPGIEPDAVVITTTPTLAEVFAGLDTWQRATASGAIEVLGTPTLARSIGRWFVWSPFVGDVRARVSSFPKAVPVPG